MIVSSVGIGSAIDWSRNMPEEIWKWLPLDIAAKHFGYGHPGSIRRRLRQLREQGLVVDIGNPPSNYPSGGESAEGKVIIFWPNPKTALMRNDAPPDLLIPKRGKRAVR